MGNENKTPFENDEGIYSKPTKAVPAPEKNIGVDTDSELLDSIVTAGTSSQLDISALESFLNVSRGRNAVYNLLDSMGEDSQISAVLESYAEDATEYNANGQIVWVESDDENVAQFVQYLLDTMNVDKHIYGWAYSLCKYGDLYLRLFRESDYEDPIFGKNDTKKRLDEAVGGEKLDEGVKVVAHSKNDRYSHYVEKVANPASMFELTKHGKTYGYIKADSGAVPTTNEVTQQQWYQYKFQQTDVEVYGPCDYVHAYLEDDSGRTVEEVTISVNKDNENKEYTYQVKRGQSILYNVFKIWRELMLLENSVLLNRVTKSSILRVIGVQVGDMPKEQVGPHLTNIKSLIEQKTAINTGASMSEYNNPGPVENCIYIPMRGEQGAITAQQIGGDVDVKSLADLEYFRDKMFGALRAQKQYFGFCLRGNTLILLLNGKKITIEEMFNNKEDYIGKGIMACAPDGSLVPTVITNIMLTKPHSSFIRVHLDNGEYVDVTNDHRMMLRDGSFVPAEELVVGDSLMPYYDKVVDGRRYVLDNRRGKYLPQYRVVAESVCDIPKGYQVHHKNARKIDDDFDNLEPLTVAEHYEKHFDLLHDSARQANSTRKEFGVGNAQQGKIAITNGIENRWIFPNEEIPFGWEKGMKKNITADTRRIMSEKRIAVLENHPEYRSMGGFKKGECREEVRHKMSYAQKKRFERMSASDREAYRNEKARFLAEYRNNPDTKEKMLAHIPSNRRFFDRYLRCPVCGNVFVKKLNGDDYSKYLNGEKFFYCCDEHYKRIDGQGKLGRSYSLLASCGFDFDEYALLRLEQPLRRDAFYKAETLKPIYEKHLVDYSPECNHKVVGIEYIDVDEPAYDISVAADCHTFALPCGIFVHNCDDAAGFNGGSSIAQNSIRYARTIKRIQMSLIQAITDAVNLMLIDKGLDNYVNRFTIKMLPPMTQAEVDRQDTIRQQMGVIQDVMNLVSDIDNQSIKLQILKTLLSTVITEPTVMQLIQEQIDVLEQEGEKAPTEEESAPHDDFGGVGIGRDLEREEEPATTEEPIEEPSEEPSEGETVDRLPSPDELNAGDFTDSDNPDFI